MKFTWGLLIILITISNVKSDDLFIPKTKKKFNYMPPYQSNLIEDSRVKLEHEEMENIQEVVQKVVTSNDKELEKTAESLVQDKDKLEKFLSAISKKRILSAGKLKKNFCQHLRNYNKFWMNFIRILIFYKKIFH